MAVTASRACLALALQVKRLHWDVASQAEVLPGQYRAGRLCGRRWAGWQQAAATMPALAASMGHGSSAQWLGAGMQPRAHLGLVIVLLSGCDVCGINSYLRAGGAATATWATWPNQAPHSGTHAARMQHARP